MTDFTNIRRLGTSALLAVAIGAVAGGAPATAQPVAGRGPAPMAAPLLVQSGQVGGGATDPTWNLNSGSGERTTVIQVRFPKRYRAPPTVMIALSYVDILNNSNARLSVTTRNVTRDSFEAVFTTWNTTQVYRAKASWIAHG